MGTYLSSLRNKYNNNNPHDVTKLNNICYICREQIIKDNLIICINPHCKIILCIKCQDIYRHNRNYCKCPNCGEIGSLGTTSTY